MEKEQFKKWVERLKYYTDNVSNAQGEINKEIAIQALLGYLSSLEIIIK